MADFFNAFLAGQQAGEQRRQSDARRNAFSTYETNPEGAIGSLMGEGLIGEAGQLQQFGQRRQAMQKREAFGQALQSGDLTAAQQAAMGDEELMGVLENVQGKARETGQVLRQVWERELAPLPYEQRRQRLQQLAPQLQQYGFQAEQVENFDPTDENGQALVSSLSIFDEPGKPISVSAGETLLDPRTMQPVYEAPAKEDLRQGADGRWYRISGNSAVPIDGTPAKAAGGGRGRSRGGGSSSPRQPYNPNAIKWD
jgi:hypothetical protein